MYGEPRVLDLRRHSFPQRRASDLRRVRRPGGAPGGSASRPIAIADSGFCVAGLGTTAHPAASAGPILRVIIALGKYHGVIAATTPTGWRSTNSRLSGSCPGMVSP